MATSRSLLLSALLASTGCAARGVAASAPGGLALEAPDGTSTTLDELRGGRDATVLVFWSATCPCVRRYQQRVDALLDRWPASRVRVVGVSSNAGERLADSLRVARERSVRIPIYRDPDGRLAGTLGARSTPTVALLDARGELRFLGWLDDEREPGDPAREPWLDRALEGVLDGRADFRTRTSTYGCAITRSLFGPAPGSCCKVSPDEGNAP